MIFVSKSDNYFFAIKEDWPENPFKTFILSVSAFILPNEFNTRSDLVQVKFKLN